jgi:hypothetical protein
MDWRRPSDKVAATEQTADQMWGYGTEDRDDLRSSTIGFRERKVSFITISKVE